METVYPAAATLVAYLIGSLSFAVIVSRVMPRTSIAVTVESIAPAPLYAEKVTL